jgi:sigma-B regulation protein RsbU (phosphoserine phosphatase)
MNLQNFKLPTLWKNDMENNLKTKQRILVVDDEPDFFDLILQKFRKQIRDSYDFVFANNGVEALEKLEEYPEISLILTDINMPEMDGLTLLKQINATRIELLEKNKSYGNKIREVVIISAYGDLSNIRTAMNHGAFDFLIKPIDLSDLEITIERTLKHITELHHIQSKNKQLIIFNNEMEVAQKIQNSILPQEIPKLKNLDISTIYIPMMNVGGDFFDYHLIDNNKLGLIIADVSGHGISAAMIASMFKIAFNMQKVHASSPHDLLKEINNTFLNIKLNHNFVTAIYAFFDMEKNKLILSNAGHPELVILKRKTKEIITKNPKGPLIGCFPDANFESEEIKLEKGDRLLFYTDCLIECRNIQGEIFGEEKLANLMQENAYKNTKEFTEHLMETMGVWSPDKSGLDDDLTVIVVDINE